MSIQKFIEDLERSLPPICTQQDLIKARLFASPHEAMLRRKRKQPPEFLYLSQKRIIYPRSSVIQWLHDQIDFGHPKSTRSLKKKCSDNQLTLPGFEID